MAPPAPQTANVHPPLQGRARALGTLALSAAVFMNVLDSSIANVSLPAIAGDLGVSASQGTWVITSLGVANAVSVPLTGWLSQRFGQVRLFMASVMLFVLSSWLCGLAPNMTALIAFRVLQGLQGMGFTAEQALAQVERVVSQQVFTLAARDIFYVSLLLFLALIPVVWLARVRSR